MDDNNFQNYNENRNSVDRSRPMGLLFGMRLLWDDINNIS